MTGLGAWALAAILHVAPWMGAQPTRAEELAGAIADAAASREEVAMLVSIAWWESGQSFDPRRAGDRGHSVSVFQLWVCPGPRCAPVRTSERYAAREAVGMARGSLAACRKLSPENRLAQYTTGRCQTNREARVRWGTAQRLLREVPWQDEEEAQMGELNRLVVWDPKGDYWEGSLVDESTERALAAHGAVTLPVDSALFGQSGVGGYARRSWGAGWPLDTRVPQAACPLTLFIPMDHRVLHWRARLVLDARHPTGPLEGICSFMPAASRAGTARAGYSPDRSPYSARELGFGDDPQRGWTVSGKGTVGVAMDGYYEFAFYGSMPGVSVAWLAASTTPR